MQSDLSEIPFSDLAEILEVSEINEVSGGQENTLFTCECCRNWIESDFGNDIEEKICYCELLGGYVSKNTTCMAHDKHNGDEKK